LSLADAREMGLASEPVTYASKVDPKIALHDCGATAAECDFLVTGGRPKAWTGERIELNAMDSVQFVAYLEAKLTAVGAGEKVVPADDALQAAFRRAWRIAKVQEAIDDA